MKNKKKNNTLLDIKSATFITSQFGNTKSIDIKTKKSNLKL